MSLVRILLRNLNSISVRSFAATQTCTWRIVQLVVYRRNFLSTLVVLVPCAVEGDGHHPPAERGEPLSRAGSAVTSPGP